MEIDLGVICASAPVLKPLLSKIPFSLSGTFSGGVSLRKKFTGSGYVLKNSKMSGTTAEDSRSNPCASNTSSKRRSEAIRAAPDLDLDQGRSYELKSWDEEREIASPGPLEQAKRSASQDAILRIETNEETAKGGKGIQKMWQKMKSRGSDSSDEDMTITMTSEVELSNEPASAYIWKRNSRHKDVFKQHQAVKDHKSSSMPLEDKQHL